VSKTRDEILNSKTEHNNKDEDHTQMEEEMTSKSYLLTRLLQLKKEINRFDDALDSIEKLVPNNEELEHWAQLQLPPELEALIEDPIIQRAQQLKNKAGDLKARQERKRRCDLNYGDPRSVRIKSEFSSVVPSVPVIPSIKNKQIESFVSRCNKPGSFEDDRLEYLGSSVLNKVVSDLISKRFPCCNSNQLAAYRACVLTNSNLLKWAQMYQLHSSPSRYINDFEVYIGRLYLDGDNSTERIVSWLALLCEPILKEIESNARDTPISDMLLSSQLPADQRFQLERKMPWTSDPAIQVNLQRIKEMPFSAMKALKEELYIAVSPSFIPEYITYEKRGLDNDPVFKVAVCLNGEVVGMGEAKNMKEAGARAAYCALSMNQEKVEFFKQLNLGIKEGSCQKPPSVTIPVVEQINNGIF
jgi:dsRNA-specific ribonuclease